MRNITISLSIIAFVLLLALPAAATDLEEVQAAIEAAGAKWTAGETSMSGLTPEQFAQYCNLEIVIPDDWEDRSKDFDVPKDMPAHLDWRDIDGRNFMTPVKDQHPCGTCATFSSVGATEALMKVRLDNAFIIPDLSEQHVYSCAGAFPYTFFHPLGVLQREGAPDETCFPYDCDFQGDQKPCEDTCEDFANRAFKIVDYQMMMFPQPEQMKAALQNGPIVSGFQVPEDFRYYTGGIYEHTGGKIAGGHGVIVAGYDDAEQYWICKNSWGTDWGEDGGWFRIRWGTCPMGFGYQSFSIGVDAAVLCQGDIPPTISEMQVMNQNPVLVEGEDLMFSFQYTDPDADLAGGELWYAVDGEEPLRYEQPLVQMVGTSSVDQNPITFTIAGPFGSGLHTVLVFVKDLCGMQSNELTADFTVEGGPVDDDDSDDDDDVEEDDDDDDDAQCCG